MKTKISSINKRTINKDTNVYISSFIPEVLEIITRISSNLQLKDDYISSIIRRSNYYYKDYYIPKRNGGRRKISQASPELKTLQYWVKTGYVF